jgi:hypothetical protein
MITITTTSKMIPPGITTLLASISSPFPNGYFPPHHSEGIAAEENGVLVQPTDFLCRSDF